MAEHNEAPVLTLKLGGTFAPPMRIILFALLMVLAPATHQAHVLVSIEEEDAASLFKACGLAGVLPQNVFDQALVAASKHGLKPHVIAIADMTRPSSERRLFIVDLDAHRLLGTTWVAHGKNSGELMCTSVSNKEGSLKTSKGLYRVGAEIESPKHGQALLLHGLDRGVNDKALEREIIIHGADYVSASFIQEHGRLGRSFGCPAVPDAMMPRMVEWLAGDGLLYVHAK